MPQLHVKDGRTGVLAGDYLGEGDANYYGVIDFLKSKDYSGWIIGENLYENTTFRSEENDVYKTFKKDMEILKKSVL